MALSISAILMTSMTNKKVYHLLQALYKYYPIGVENICNQEYLGFVELEKIGQEKFVKVCEERLEPWTSMITEMRQKSKYQLVDCAPSPTPYLHAYSIIRQEEKNDEQDILYYNFELSLLGPFYTSYYVLQKRAKDRDQTFNLAYTIYKNHPYMLKSEINIDMDLDSMIKKYYPDYEYFKHDFLMNLPIKFVNHFNIPNMSIYVCEGTAPIYDFFFSGPSRVNALLILE